MLKSKDIEITRGRGIGGDSIIILHKPTGIRRGKGPPLTKEGKTQQEMIREIETELIQRGLTQYILPDRKPKR
jgi:hypothetical protein